MVLALIKKVNPKAALDAWLSLAEEEVREELRERTIAWWEGREFDPEEMARIREERRKAEEQAAAAGAPAKVRPLADEKDVGSAPPRIRALETLWGRGRYSPGSGEIDNIILDMMGRQKGRIGKLGLVGVNAITADTIAAAFGEEVVVSEWRMECARRTARVSDNVVVKKCDLDRMASFEDGTLKAIASLDAMTFVDHKQGFAARVYRALRDGGRWAALDYCAAPGFKPVASFASSWAEAQLPNENQMRNWLETSGFRNVSFIDATDAVLDEARGAFARLGAGLDDTAASGLDGREGALLLQEISWEVAAWRSRIKALESGALRVLAWKADKPGSDILEEESSSFVAAVGERENVSDMPVSGEADWGDLSPKTDGEDADVASDTSATESSDEDAGGWDVDDTGGTDAAEEEDEENPLDQGAIDSLFD